ncbi:hypothetical protein SAMN04488516_1058 [Desulfonauticus submarinus]|uniref:Uncharacterized protein n=1 Tax=Desulfonauticus submarinus TaxID=206665 RepID=A0A1H0DGG3_9BACT|nr:hypothetical protein [Desulfonauticus submarinus]SDN69198.1 hypothetical protein SAMN04488516_1058 [Desulfonauticus submarinus]
MNSLKVNKLRRGVCLVFSNKEVWFVDVFVSRYSFLYEKSERVIDILNGNSLFLPVKAKNNDIFLINKNHLLQVKLSKDDLSLEFDDYILTSSTTKLRQVKVYLNSGNVLCGYIMLESLEHTLRVLDYLNMTKQFFPLFTEENIIYLNRSKVVWLKERTSD